MYIWETFIGNFSRILKLNLSGKNEELTSYEFEHFGLIEIFFWEL